MSPERGGRRLNLSLEPITGALVFALLILGSLARGLFFQADLLPFQVAVVAVFALEWLERIARRDGTLLAGWHEMLPLLLALVYCASFAVAVDKRPAAGEALKYLTLFMVYWVMSRLAGSRGWAVRFANLVVFIAVLLSAVGLGAAVGVVEFPGAYVRGEILSTFQYSNALAGFLAAACVIILTLWGPRLRPARPAGAAKPTRAARPAGAATAAKPADGEPDRDVSWPAEAWYSFAFVICAVVLLSTRSRGSWVLLPVAGALALMAMPAGTRFRAGLRASAAVVATLVILRRVDGIIAAANRALSAAASAAAAAAAAGDSAGAAAAAAQRQAAAQTAALKIAALVGAATVGVLAAVLVLRLVAVALRGADTPPQTQRVARIALSAWAVGVAAWYTVYASAAYPSVARGFFAPRTAAEIESIDVGASGLIARETMWGDAVRMVMDRPLLGAGGGGWNALYHMYQRRLYSSALVHSHPLEVAVETGIPGFIIYSAMWALMARNAWMLWRRRSLAEAWGEPDLDAEVAWEACLPAFCGAVALGLHSAVDFDFSFPAIAAVAWGLMACVNSVAVGAAEGAAATPAALFSSADGPTAVWVRPAGPVIRGPAIRTRSPAAQAAVGLAMCAVVLVPTVRFVRAADLGTSAAGRMMRGNYAGAEDMYRQAIRLDPYTASYWIDLAQLSLVSYTVDARQWRLDQVREYCARAVSVQPSSLPARIRATELLSAVGDLDEALRLADENTKWIPRDVRVYEGLANVYVKVAVAALEAGDRARAAEYAGKARDVIPVAAKSINPDPGPRVAEALVGLAETPSMGYAVGQACLLLGDYAAAGRLLEKATRSAAIRADAQLMLGVAYEMAGDASRSRRALEFARNALGSKWFDARYAEIRRMAGAAR